MADRVTRRQFVQESVIGAATLAAGLSAAGIVHAGNPAGEDTSKILNYNPDMEYRPLGKTGLTVSAVCLGGHWKRVEEVINAKSTQGWQLQDVNNNEFLQNRTEVVSRCIERGINYIDACVPDEILAYSKAIKGRRDKMYLGFSWYIEEMRNPACRKREKLQAALDKGMKQAGLDHVDLWRITLLEQSIEHTDAEIDEAMAALDWAKKSGRARFAGISSHHRPHIKGMIEQHHDVLDVILTPVHGQHQGRHRRGGSVGDRPEAQDRLVRHQAVCQQLAVQGHEQSEGPQRQGRQPPGAAGHSLHPLQPGHHRPHPRADHPATGGQRRPGRQGTAHPGRDRTGRSRRRHGARLG